MITLNPYGRERMMLFISPFFCVSYPLLLLLGLPPGSPSSAQVPTPVLLPCPHPPSSTPFPDPSSVVELFHRPSRHSATSCRCSLYTHGLEQVCCGSGFGALSHTPRPPLVTPPPLVNFGSMEVQVFTANYWRQFGAKLAPIRQLLAPIGANFWRFQHSPNWRQIGRVGLI